MDNTAASEACLSYITLVFIYIYIINKKYYPFYRTYKQTYSE